MLCFFLSGCRNLTNNEKLDIFYSPQDVTYINCEFGFRRLLTRLLPKIYLYCIMENGIELNKFDNQLIHRISYFFYYNN